MSIDTLNCLCKRSHIKSSVQSIKQPKHQMDIDKTNEQMILLFSHNDCMVRAGCNLSFSSVGKLLQKCLQAQIYWERGGRFIYWERGGRFVPNGFILTNVLNKIRKERVSIFEDMLLAEEWGQMILSSLSSKGIWIWICCSKGKMFDKFEASHEVIPTACLSRNI